MKRVEGRKILVVGGSGEIGVDIVRALAEEGADVAIQYFHNKTEADKVCEAVKALGQSSVAIQAQITSAQSVLQMRDELHEKFGKIDTLVNCAGINRDSMFSKMTDEQWDEVIGVDLSGVFRCSKAFAEEIASSGHGRIINIASVVGETGNIGQVNYAAAKSGVIGFTKGLARELARSGTTVNVVAPGFISTGMVNRIPDKTKEKILAQIPMGRFGTPREVAMSVVYLASHDGDYITGSVLNLNGGMYL
jgi:3-oxoacyl-[acyl-carrier protein] reductase